ncbi:hypothetical protein [Micromonospora sp. DT227]|uniref:hypothetical protein n=1 Tax=Micromonospora sp. DT227 TaxID=3393433 RepID=UPI003CEB806F
MSNVKRLCQSLLLALLAFGGGGVLSSGCASMREGTDARDAGRASSDRSISVPAVTPPVPSYRAAGGLCARLDLREVGRLVGLTGDQRDVSAGSGRFAGTSCVVTVGRLPSGVVVTVRADIGGAGSGRVMFEGLRQAQGADLQVSDLSGLGAAAYFCVDPVAGVTVATYDANVYLTVTAAALRPGGRLPDAVAVALRDTASSALDALRV